MPINTGTEAATIRLDSTGAVTGAFGIASHGQGLETALAQVIADELGARIEDIRILQGDNATVAYSTVTYASRSGVPAGGAATLAARLLRERVIRAASYLLEASVEDIKATPRSARRCPRGRLGPPDPAPRRLIPVHRTSRLFTKLYKNYFFAFFQRCQTRSYPKVLIQKRK